MTKWLIFFFIIIPNQLYSQKKISKYFSYGIFYEPNLSFRILTFGNGSEQQKQWFKERKSTEKPLLCSKFGTNILYHLSKKWAIKSGITLSSYGRIDQPTTLTIQSQGGNIVILNENKTKFARRIRYIELPIMAQYKFAESNFISFLELGFIPSKYLHSRTEVIKSSGKNSSRKYHLGQVKDYNLGIECLIGFNLFSKEKITLLLSPSFSIYLLRSERKNIHPINEYLYSFGLRMQLYFSELL